MPARKRGRRAQISGCHFSEGTRPCRAGRTDSHSDRSQAPQRLGAVWTWQELVGTVALIPFQSFKLPRRLPVSGPRLPARGSHVQATGTAADGSGQCVLGRGSNLEPEHKRDRRAGCLRLTHSAAVFIGLPSGGACAPGGRMTHYGEGSKY